MNNLNESDFETIEQLRNYYAFFTIEHEEQGEKLFDYTVILMASGLINICLSAVIVYLLFFK